MPRIFNLTGGSSDGSGNVTGPGSSTDNAVARFDGTDGATIQNSNATITDSGDLYISLGNSSPYVPNGGGIVIEPYNGTTGGGADNLAYARLMFNPEKATVSSSDAPDVILSAHKYHSSGALHEHFSVYTSNAAGTATKRLDLDYLQDLATWNFGNSNVVIDGTLSSADTNFRALKVNPTLSGAGAAPAGFEQNTTFSPSVSITNAYGQLNIGKGSPGAGVTVTNLYSAFDRLDTGSTAGSITNAYARFIGTPSFGTLKPTTNYGQRIQNQGSSGITTTYGLRIDAQSGSGTNKELSVDGVGEFSGDVTVPDEAYGAGWDGSLEVPTKNALYDKIETISGVSEALAIAYATAL